LRDVIDSKFIGLVSACAGIAWRDRRLKHFESTKHWT